MVVYLLEGPARPRLNDSGILERICGHASDLRSIDLN